MSYQIEYGRQFIRSQSGITALWLTGPNNVTEISPHGRERWVRSWECFGNLLGVSEQEIMEYLRSLASSGGDTLWMRDNTWMEGAAIIRWGQSGLKQASTFEELLQHNPGLFMRGCLSIWEKHDENIELFETIESTEALDNWIVRAKERILHKAGDERIYPMLEFSQELITNFKPDIPQKPYNAILQVSSGICSGMYVCGVGKTYCRFTPDIGDAKRYADQKSAKRAQKKIEEKYPDTGLSVIVF